MREGETRTRRRRTRRHGSSKALRSVLLSVGLCSLALAPVLFILGLFFDERRLWVYTAAYMALATSALLLRWALLIVRRRRKMQERRRRDALTSTNATARP